MIFQFQQEIPCPHGSLQNIRLFDSFRMSPSPSRGRCKSGHGGNPFSHCFQYEFAQSFETSLLDIIRPWKKVFNPYAIISQYWYGGWLRKGVKYAFSRRFGHYPHFKKNGYTTIYQLMASLPGVRQIDYYDFIYEGLVLLNGFLKITFVRENSKEAASIDDKVPFLEKTPIPEHPPGSSGGGLRSPYAKNEPKVETPIPEHPQGSSGGGLRSPYAKNEPKVVQPLPTPKRSISRPFLP